MNRYQLKLAFLYLLTSVCLPPIGNVFFLDPSSRGVGVGLSVPYEGGSLTSDTPPYLSSDNKTLGDLWI